MNTTCLTSDHPRWLWHQVTPHLYQGTMAKRRVSVVLWRGQWYVQEVNRTERSYGSWTATAQRLAPAPKPNMQSAAAYTEPTTLTATAAAYPLWDWHQLNPVTFIGRNDDGTRKIRIERKLHPVKLARGGAKLKPRWFACERGVSQLLEGWDGESRVVAEG